MLKFLLLGFLMLGLRAQVPAIPCKGGDDCCDNVTCGLGEGDCDSHEDCVGHLRCGNDNCDGPGFDSTDDCCWEDPKFPRPPVPKDAKMCETRWRFEQNIVQAAAALGCGFAKGVERKVSLEQCSQTSCSSKLIGESFTCNNQNKEQTCIELENLHIDVQDRINTQCKNVLRGPPGDKETTKCGDIVLKCMGTTSTNIAAIDKHNEKAVKCCLGRGDNGCTSIEEQFKSSESNFACLNCCLHLQTNLLGFDVSRDCNQLCGEICIDDPTNVCNKKPK